MLVFMTYSFYYAKQGGVSGETISICFSTSILFAILLFRLIYKQHLSYLGLVGSVLIIICNLLIGCGGIITSGPDGKSNSKVLDE